MLLRWTTAAAAMLALATGSAVWAAGEAVHGAATAGDAGLAIDAGSLVEIHGSGDSGSALVALSGLPALGQAAFTTTSLEPEQRTVMHLGVDPSPSALYTFPGAGKQFVLLPQTQLAGVDFATYSRLFIVEAESDDAPSLALYAGIDFDNDGKPGASEKQCFASTTHTQTTLRCIVDLHAVTADPKNVWALIDVPSGPAGSYIVKVSAAVPSVGFQMPVGMRHVLLATGPGHVAAGAPFTARVAWNSDAQPVEPDTRYYAAVLVDAAPGRPLQQLGRDGLVPIAFTRASGADDPTDAYAPNFAHTIVLSAGARAAHRFIDVDGTGTLALHTKCPDTLCTSKLDFNVVRADFPPTSVQPAGPAAPLSETQWSLDTLTTRDDRTIPVTPGRWYIVVKNSGKQAAQVAISGTLSTAGAPAAPAPGSYYNPQRGGHGIFLSRAGNQQALYWYTYLEDGTPVWYTAQATAPEGAATTWNAPLLRVNWDGKAVDGYDVVGDAVVTPVSAQEFIYSWHVNGIGGSERFVQLAPSSCLTFQGAPADFTGQWYAPAQPGYGMDVLGLSTQQFDAFYLYDALGEPRWVAGSVPNFSASSSVAMNQLSGFCPSCSYAPTVATPVGTLNVNYADATQGHYTTALTLAAPLTGTWNVDQPIVRLTGSTSCNR